MDKRFKTKHLDRPNQFELELNDFCASDVPRGFAAYDLSILVESQQIKLNDLKVQTVRENQKYLAAHPEIRGVISLLLRHMFMKYSHFHIHNAIAKFFSQPVAELEDTVAGYLTKMGDTSFEERLRKVRAKERERLDRQLWEDYQSEVKNVESGRDQSRASDIVRSIISEILDNVVARPNSSSLEETVKN